MRKLVLGCVIIVIAIGAFLIGKTHGVSQNKAICPASTVSVAQVDTDIRVALKAQDAAWNAGDIDGFMSYYWQSEDLRFASGGTITTGWQPTLERYKVRYPDKATMGTLTFDNLEISRLGPCDALVFGRWQLDRADDTPNGLFTLHMRSTAKGWRVVSDHTSSS